MRLLAFFTVLPLAACAPSHPLASAPSPSPEPNLGVLVMAHGGTGEWDRAIQQSVAPVAAIAPTVVALGMADPGALAAALDSLKSLGVERVAVVRLFISGASFLDQTRYLLGLSDDAPAVWVLHGGHGAHAAADPTPIAHGLAVATHKHGVMGSIEASDILAGRAMDLSREPSRESVLLVAHGMGDEAENDAVLSAMSDAAQDVARRGFARVEVATLREDWPEKRVAEEGRIREFVQRESAAGRRVIVVPYRLHGFGPYAAVLEGEAYAAAEGLVPDASVTRWIERTAAEVACRQGWAQPFGECESPR